MEARKDNRGRRLKKGEFVRKSDGRFCFSYSDALGRRRYIYDRDLLSLREKEEEIQRDLLDGLDLYQRNTATLNATFDRYMKTKYGLRGSSENGYYYMYDHFVRNSIGDRLISSFKFSDIMQFYLKLLKEDDIELATLDNVHCLLHPTFQMAVRDDIIRKNPTDGAMAEVCKCGGKNRNSREALTMDQLRTFMGYIASHPIFCAWWPIFVVLFGTGLRAGEFVGLTWDDIDMEKRTISVNHTLSYYKKRGEKICRMHVHRPKTDAGTRLIPMLDSVKLAFEMAKEELEGCEYEQPVIDGLTNFVFLNKYSTVHNPQTLNREIKCIVAHYNAEEEKRALKEKRDPVLLPDFSLHICRHTFATRLVEVCTNLKVITSIMGHKSVETTMDIYADPSETKNNEIMGLLSDKMDDVF